MGGDIKVESHLGEGSIFDITFKKFDGKSVEKHNVEMDKMKEFRGKA